MGKLKVLIVDDDAVFAENFRKYLEIMGYEAAKAGTAESALKLIKDTKPDILLCDLKLPDVDGNEIVRQTKGLSPKTIIFVVSAYVDTNTELRLKKLGISKLIYKPIVFDEVLEMFKKATP